MSRSTQEGKGTSAPGRKCPGSEPGGHGGGMGRGGWEVQTHPHLEVWSGALVSLMKLQGQEAAGLCLAHSMAQLMFV